MAVKIVDQDTLKFGEGVMIVDFAAEWCGPCKALMPMLKDLSEKYTGKVEVVTVDISDNMDLARQHKVSNVPCLVVFKDGKEVDRMIGFSGRDSLEKLFVKHS